ncbi:MAG: antiviral reverse transcriptase Drt3a [Methylophilaceae bacterium]
MYDSSFNKFTLAKTLRKEDFFAYPSLKDEIYRAVIISKAVASASTCFNGHDPLVSFSKKGKTIYKIQAFEDELVLRKANENLRKATQTKQQNRDSIIKNLIHLLSEGVPYRIYRLDIKSFYESFSSDYIKKELDSLVKLNPNSKKLIEHLLAKYTSIGGLGLPRGLALSATLSELLMSEFDKEVRNKSGVYFYARYVDDILIITNGLENCTLFIKDIKLALPIGLGLNSNKQKIRTAQERVDPLATVHPSVTVLEFDYLGYKFKVTEPYKVGSGKKPSAYFRNVDVDISLNKIKKIKSRISRTFHDFSKTKDFSLLTQRIKYLTTNYRLKELGSNKYRLAGIYYSYPLLSSSTGKGLQELEHYLKNSIYSKFGRIFSKTSALLSAKEKKELLGNSFIYGYKTKCMVHFHPKKMNKIQECWANE